MSKKRKDPIDYIRLRLIGGYSKEKVQELLKRKGWSEEEIEQGIKEAEKRISEMPKRLMTERLVFVLKVAGFVLVVSGIVFLVTLYETEDEKAYNEMLDRLNSIESYTYEVDMDLNSYDKDLGMHFNYNSSGFTNLDSQDSFYESDFTTMFEFEGFGENGTGSPEPIFGARFYGLFDVQDDSAILESEGSEQGIARGDSLYAAWGGSKRNGFVNLYDIVSPPAEGVFVEISRQEIEEHDSGNYPETPQEGLYSVFATSFNQTSFNVLANSLKGYTSRNVSFVGEQEVDGNRFREYAMDGDTRELFRIFRALSHVHADHFLVEETINSRDFGRVFSYGLSESGQTAAEGLIWIDPESSFVHRLRVSVYIELEQQEKTLDAVLDVSFSDINEDMDIEAPAEDETITAEDYLSGL